MILNASEVKTKSTLDNESTFRIQSSAKAFKILSSNLYKDKISAVIREISTNAVDAHKAINLKDPISVHLPTEENSAFIVNDFGVGMNDDEVRELYTTYFGSNKTSSNDYVGALGLGSKSPFAYTDKFTIESAKDGQKNIYSCYLNEDGMPVVSRVGSFAVNFTGTKVIIPVGKYDRRDFVNKATKIYRYFEQIPLTNLTSITSSIEEKIAKEKTDIIYKGESYTLTKNKLYEEDSFEAIMGNIRYPLKTSQSKILEDHPLVRLLRNQRNTKIAIQVPIGTLDIAPSREELSYDRATVSNLHQIFNNINEDLTKKLIKKVRDFKLGKDRVKFITDNKGFLSSISSDSDGIEEFKLNLAPEEVWQRLNQVFLVKGNAKTKKLHRVAFYSLSSREIAVNYYPAVHITMDATTLRKVGMKARIIKYMSLRDIRRVVIVDPTEMARNRFFLDGCDFITVDDLPERDKVIRSSAPFAGIQTLKAVGLNGEKLEDIKKQVFYIGSKNGEMTTLREILRISKPMFNDNQVINLFRSMSKPVVILSASELYKNKGRIAKNPKLIELTPEMIEASLTRKVSKIIKEHADVVEMMAVFAESNPNIMEHGNISRNNVSGIEQFYNATKLLPPSDLELLLTIKSFKTIYDVGDFTDKHSLIVSRFRSLFEFYEAKTVNDIMAKKIKKVSVNSESKKEFVEFTKKQNEVANNIILKAFLNHIDYWNDAKIAKILLDSFVNL